MLSRNLLRRYTVEQLQEALRMRKSFERRDKLEAERASLLKALAKIEGKLGKLNGEPVRRRGPGRQPKTSKPGRRKGYKLSAETRRRMSEAAKRRYAKKPVETAKPESS